jgi:uncharacterized membrane protein SpoIIM required for sporulation
MRQIEFERRHAELWASCDAWLVDRQLSKRARRKLVKKGAAPPPPTLTADQFPLAYRTLCSHLALARERFYSPQIVDRLNDLVMRGHQVLYGAQAPSGPGVLSFLVRGFPALVRREWRVHVLASVLFYGPLLLLLAALQVYPDFANVVMSPEQLAEAQAMYDPANEALGRREAGDSFQAFAMYVWNNVRIGFQTFAGGVLFGLGTLFFLLFNGIYIGAFIGHLTQVGLGPQIWSFVAGHSALELTAIVISGAAGLKLGHALLAPGRRSRKLALVEDGAVAFRLAGGAGFMFFAAAIIEGFWSPLRFEQPLIKYAVGAVFWLLVLIYFWGAGRDAAGSAGGTRAA